MKVLGGVEERVIRRSRKKGREEDNEEEISKDEMSKIRNKIKVEKAAEMNDIPERV